MREWHETYAEDGLVIIGNHYPEFNFERDIANVRESLTRLDVPYPVLIDNERETWGAYGNRFWPTIYLIDKRGNIRYVHIGEGAYDETELNIQALLSEEYIEPIDYETLPILSVSPTEVLNVRAGAGIDHERIGVIHPGESYYIVDVVEDWYQINYDNTEAYVFGEYVEVYDSTLETDPEITPEATEASDA